jgi:ubiquinone/menaquinone biosynthesis C-methylase UbiE
MDDWRSYDGVAEIYARVHAPRFAEPARDLVAFAGVRAGERMLDLGTGTGVTAVAAAEAGATVVGVDASIEMLKRTVADGQAFARVAGEAVDLPFRDRSFDVVTGNFVLAHFAKVDTALYDTIRVTRPGGRVAFTTWSDGPDAFQQTWRELVESVVPREVLSTAMTDAAPGHDRFRQREVVEMTLYDAGLRRIRSETHKYRWSYSIDEYVDGLSSWAVGRFARGMLGEQGFARFLERARASFVARFPNPIQDFRDVILAVGTKE